MLDPQALVNIERIRGMAYNSSGRMVKKTPDRFRSKGKMYELVKPKTIYDKMSTKTTISSVFFNDTSRLMLVLQLIRSTKPCASSSKYYIHFRHQFFLSIILMPSSSDILARHFTSCRFFAIGATACIVSLSR